MSDEKKNTTIKHQTITPDARHYLVGGNAMSALRLLAKYYGKPTEGGSEVPRCWEWDMAKTALDQWEALGKESEALEKHRIRLAGSTKIEPSTA